MKVKSSKNGSACTLTVEGKIDTMTAPELDEAVKSNLPKCDKMIFDFTNVEYITSTGVNEGSKKIFTVTGMYKILKIK